MSHDTMTTMTIGGPLARQFIDELNDRIPQDFYNRTDGGEDIAEVGEAGDRLILQGYTHSGDASAVVAFCVDHGLSYHLAWEADYDIDAGVTYWRPGMEKEVTLDADSGGEPVITLIDLQQALEGQETIDDVVARMRPASQSAVPPLSLIDAPDDDPNHGEQPAEQRMASADCNENDLSAEG